MTFLFFFPWPQQSHHNASQTLLCSISVWHSSTNCMKLGLQPLLHPISGGAEGFPLLIIWHRNRVTVSSRIRQVAQVDIARLGSSCFVVLSPAGVKTGWGGGWLVTKPIIFTYLLLPARRHVILNGLSDPWAGSEPLENTVSQMKLSWETA